MRVNKKLAVISMLALAGTTGGLVTYLHQGHPTIVHADDSTEALNHGDYDGWSEQVGKSHFVIINALNNQKMTDEHSVSQAKVDEENKSIFANGRKVYQKYGFKDHMTEAEANKAYQNLYNAYFSSADGLQTYIKDTNEIYKDCGPSGYTVVAVKTDEQDPQQFDILVTPKGQESSFKDQVTKIYQSDFDHDKKLVKDGNDYRASVNDLIAKYYFDQGTDDAANASATSSSSVNASSAAASSATKPSSTATSTSKADHNSDATAVETNLVPTPLPSETTNADDNTGNDDPADSNDDPTNTDSPADNSADSESDNQASSQSATNAQPAANGQSDRQTASSPNNQTLPQTGTKASAGLLILAAIPLLSSLQILLPNDTNK